MFYNLSGFSAIVRPAAARTDFTRIVGSTRSRTPAPTAEGCFPSSPGKPCATSGRPNSWKLTVLSQSPAHLGNLDLRIPLPTLVTGRFGQRNKFLIYSVKGVRTSQIGEATDERRFSAECREPPNYRDAKKIIGVYRPGPVE